MFDRFPELCRVLVADPNPRMLGLMSRLLRLSGYIVRTAVSVADARRLCESYPFDLLITEIDLGDGSGLELMSQSAKALPAYGIVVTDDDSEVQVNRATALGFGSYLVKPISFASLLALIDRATTGDHAVGAELHHDSRD